MRIAGFEIIRKRKDSENESFTPQQYDDGGVEVGKAYGGAYSSVIDIDGQSKNETDLINRYRQIALQPEMSQAVDEIVNEAISIDEKEDVVEINLDKVEASDKIKKSISTEFKNILSILDFSTNAYEIFYKFYIDGRLNFHIIIDKENLKQGIIELRYIDPRKIQLVREYDENNKNEDGSVVKKVTNEYYVYFENGAQNTTQGAVSSTTWSFSSATDAVKISKDAIIRVTSGMMDENNKIVLSWIHKAIRPLNQVRMLEDATLIYTLVRAPQRRAFYVDVGNLPRAKADAYLFEMMNRHKNKTAYDAQTGQITDDRNILSMTEDYWFPRREGNRSTEIDTIEGGAQITDSENLNYFKRNLYKSLNVPISRLEPENMYSFGRTNEISREEVKFSKFIRRLRSRFAGLFKEALKVQLILKNVITIEEWEEFENNIKFDYNQDNLFEELKELEIMKERISMARDMEEGIGRYYSLEYVRKFALRMTEEEIKEQDGIIEQEKKDGKIPDDAALMDDGDGGGFGGGSPAPKPAPKPAAPKKPEPDDDDEKDDDNE